MVNLGPTGSVRSLGDLPCDTKAYTTSRAVRRAEDGSYWINPAYTAFQAPFGPYTTMVWKNVHGLWFVYGSPDDTRGASAEAYEQSGWQKVLKINGKRVQGSESLSKEGRVIETAIEPPAATRAALATLDKAQAGEEVLAGLPAAREWLRRDGLLFMLGSIVWTTTVTGVALGTHDETADTWTRTILESAAVVTSYAVGIPMAGLALIALLAIIAG